MKRIFIDGSAGTTGLRIADRLAERKDIEKIILPESLRKDVNARKEALNAADVAFLCLPDDAAREAVSLLENDNTAIIDTSTAHRTAPGWVYGFPEIGGRRELIRNSRRIANPGCHAGGFVALVAPLIELGLLSPDAALSCFSITGYSGGGKKMITQYESPELDSLLTGPRQYGLSQKHKHLPEMQMVCGLDKAPVFCPVVADFYAGMEVTVPLFAEIVLGGKQAVEQAYREYYVSGLVRYVPDAGTKEGGYLSAAALEGKDNMQITVCGNEERILLVARFDNLGKGASGAAIQNMNILLGVDETTGLNLMEG